MGIRKHLLVNIRGCNGAGKSTIPMSMMNDPLMYVDELEYNGKPKKALTVFPSYGWVALGTYFNKTGGMDTFPNKAFTAAALSLALENYPKYDILMEGVIASTIKSTYAEMFHKVENNPRRKVIVLSLLPPLEVCLERIQQRNGGKPIKEEQVASKWRTVERNVQYFRDQGFTSIRVDSSKISKSHMLAAFMKTVERHRGD